MYVYNIHIYIYVYIHTHILLSLLLYTIATITITFILSILLHCSKHCMSLWIDIPHVLIKHPHLESAPEIPGLRSGARCCAASAATGGGAASARAWHRSAARRRWRRAGPAGQRPRPGPGWAGWINQKEVSEAITIAKNRRFRSLEAMDRFLAN